MFDYAKIAFRACARGANLPSHVQQIGPVAQLAEQQTLNLRVVGSIPTRLTTFSSALSDGAKYLNSGAVTAVRLNRFPSNATPSEKNSC
jgi:hypothetical protein